jgi:hypothetical protein
VDWTISEPAEQCKVYDFKQYFSQQARVGVEVGANVLSASASAKKPADASKSITHICPGYAKGFAFYEGELSQFSQEVTTAIVTLLSSKAFDEDQRWDLLQLATHSNFEKLAAPDQLALLSLVSDSPALSIHLLLASLNNHMKIRAHHSARRDRSWDGSWDICWDSIQGVDADAAIDPRRYSPALYDGVRHTLHLLLDVRRSPAIASAYVNLVVKPGFLGGQGELGMYLNRLIQRDIQDVSADAIIRLMHLVTEEAFATLLLSRQRLLLQSLENLRALEWPDSVDHLIALAQVVKQANRKQLSALRRYFRQ